MIWWRGQEPWGQEPAGTDRAPPRHQQRASGQAYNLVQYIDRSL